MTNGPLQRVVIVGGGGHARVVIDVLQTSCTNIQLVAATDGDPTLMGSDVWGVPIVGDDSAYERLRQDGVAAAIVAVGDNALRMRLSDRVRAAGFRLINAVHHSAVVSPNACLGCGVAVIGGAVINAGAVIGDDTIINTAASVDHDCIVERGCHIAPGSRLGGSVLVGRGAFIGIGATVIPGIQIGEGAIVGAGSVVIRNVAPGARVVGVPARPIN